MLCPVKSHADVFDVPVMMRVQIINFRKGDQMTEHEQRAFEHLLKSINRIRARTERDVEAAVQKFRKTCKNSKGATLTPPVFVLSEPKASFRSATY
jgi:hypothetical protein